MSFLLFLKPVAYFALLAPGAFIKGGAVSVCSALHFVHDEHLAHYGNPRRLHLVKLLNWGMTLFLYYISRLKICRQFTRWP